ncbi:MAG: enoyl-CoA hydratase/isomerase family protein [Pseudomonadota bacterium]
MARDSVRYEEAGGIARITLDRAEKHNALNHALLDGLDEALAAVERSRDVRVVVLAGEGPSFCAGYDLGGSDYTTPPAPEGEWTVDNALMTLRGIESRYQRLWNLPVPTIARVHGHALAAGCYLQLLCDISVAAEDARLGHPAVRMGGVTSMPLWQEILGPRIARYLLMTGRTVSGAEAARLGLVTLTVASEALDDTVNGIVDDCLEVPRAGALHAKEALNTALEIQGVGALFRYHGQMNGLGRLRGGRL